MIQKIHSLRANSTVDNCLIQLLVKGIVIESGQAPVEERTDLGGISAIVPPGEILLKLDSCKPPIMNLLVTLVLFVANSADSYEGLLYAWLQLRVVSLHHVILVGVHLEALNHLDDLVLHVHFLNSDALAFKCRFFALC